jgi:hypothetical protein
MWITFETDVTMARAGNVLMPGSFVLCKSEITLDGCSTASHEPPRATRHPLGTRVDFTLVHVSRRSSKGRVAGQVLPLMLIIV